MNERELKLCCFTYNLKEKSLSDDEINTILSPHKQKYFDLYIIATQECERSTLLNIFYSDKSSFEIKLQNFFGEQFYNLKSITLGGIHLIIFVKKKLKSFIENFSNYYIKTGFYHLLSNKGAVTITINIFNYSFLFINSHLINGKEKLIQRNNDSHFIYKSLCSKNEKINILIWLGCLNYKVDTKLEQFSEAYIKGKELSLLEYDQMLKEKKNNKEFIFKQFFEGEIKFFPTSKYEVGSNKIDWNDKNNYPAWADRIFYKMHKYPKDNFSFDLIQYNSMNDITFSDHKPVFAYFNFTYSSS